MFSVSAVINTKEIISYWLSEVFRLSVRTTNKDTPEDVTALRQVGLGGFYYYQ